MSYMTYLNKQQKLIEKGGEKIDDEDDEYMSEDGSDNSQKAEKKAIKN